MIEQRTEAWFLSRLGKVTASRVADVIAKTKSGPSASRENYATQLVLERLTNSVGEAYSNAAMQWGTDQEPNARNAYELKMSTFVKEVGFIDHPTIDMSGASPDGFVGEDGLVEIKCPNSSTHIDTLVSQKVPAKYLPQMQWQMACTGAKATDFVSFDDRLPEGLQLFVKRVERDNEMIAMLEKEARKFLEEVQETTEKLELIREQNVKN